MKEAKRYQNILSIESAVMDGGVAIIREKVIRSQRAGSSRAEKIISVISSVLDEAEITLQDLDLIAVSTGPGSYSGIRIGASTALGLADSLGIPCMGVSVLEAMASGSDIEGRRITAVPVGKSDVAWQLFEAGKDGVQISVMGAEVLSSLNFVQELARLPGTVLFAQTDLLTRIADELSEETACEDAGTVLAGYVGRFASTRDEPQASMRPIYLRNRDALVRPNAF